MTPHADFVDSIRIGFTVYRDLRVIADFGIRQWKGQTKPLRLFRPPFDRTGSGTATSELPTTFDALCRKLACRAVTQPGYQSRDGCPMSRPRFLVDHDLNEHIWSASELEEWKDQAVVGVRLRIGIR